MARIPKRVFKKVKDYDERIEEIRGEMFEAKTMEEFDCACRKRNNLQIKKIIQLQKYARNT